MDLVVNYGRSNGSTPIFTPDSYLGQKKASLTEAVDRIHKESQKIISNPNFFCTKRHLQNAYSWKERVICTKEIREDIASSKNAATLLKTNLLEKRGKLSFFNFFTFLVKWTHYTIHIYTLSKAEANFAKHVEVLFLENRKCVHPLDYLHLLTSLGFEHNQELAEYLFENQKPHLTLSNELKLLKSEVTAFNKLIIKFLKYKYPETHQIALKAYKIGPETLITPTQLTKALKTLKTAHKLTESDIEALLASRGFKDYLSPTEFSSLKAKFSDGNFSLESPGSSLVTNLDQALFKEVCEELTGKEYAEVGAQSKGIHYRSRPIQKEERAMQLLFNLGYTNNAKTVALAQFLSRSNLCISCYAHLTTKEEIRQFNKIVVDFLKISSPPTAFYSLEALLEEGEDVIPESVLHSTISDEIPPLIFDQRFERLLQNMHLDLNGEEKESLKTLLKQFNLEITKDGNFPSDLRKKEFQACFLELLTKHFPQKTPLLKRVIDLNQFTDHMPNPYTLLKRCKNNTPLSETTANALLQKFGFSKDLPFYETLKVFIITSDYQIKSLRSISLEEKDEFSYLCYNFLLKTYPRKKDKILTSCTHFFKTYSKSERKVTPRALLKAYTQINSNVFQFFKWRPKA